VRLANLRTRFRHWFRPRRKFRLTREGKWFIGATLLLGFAAVNGGLNLLFLMFGLLLCLLIANGILSEASLRNLDVSRQLPPAIFAGTPFLTGISVRNPKRRIATFSLEVEDLMENRTPIDRRCFFLKIPGRRQQETSYRRTLPKRGIHRLTGLRISTRFPFGLLRRSIDIQAPADLLVYPALVPVPEAEVRTQFAPQIGQHASIRARSGDFEGLRELRPDDDPRDIHWRTSARRGRLFVREFNDDSGRSLIVSLDRHATTDPDDFERAVSWAASLAMLYLRRGFAVGLLAGETFIAPDDGPSQGGQILRCLALVEARSDKERPSGSPAASWRGSSILTVSPSPGHPRVTGGVGGVDRRSA
jgi:uncharacterized protein (DUF58 family)